MSLRDASTATGMGAAVVVVLDHAGPQAEVHSPGPLTGASPTSKGTDR